MQHNYYVGFQLPSALRHAIEQAQKELFDHRLMSAPLEPHITILPPPAVERLEPEELARQVKVTAMPFWPLKLTLTKVATYKDFAIAISVKSKEVYQLQQTLLELLPPDVEAIYFPNPAFSPHVTLAHAGRGKSFPASLAAEFAKKLEDILPATFTAESLTLFRWIAPREYKAIVI